MGFRHLSQARRTEAASKGGRLSSSRLTPEERSARARKAAEARWLEEDEADGLSDPSQDGPDAA